MGTTSCDERTRDENKGVSACRPGHEIHMRCSVSFQVSVQLSTIFWETALCGKPETDISSNDSFMYLDAMCVLYSVLRSASIIASPS